MDLQIKTLNVLLKKSFQPVFQFIVQKSGTEIKKLKNRKPIDSINHEIIFQVESCNFPDMKIFHRWSLS